MKPLALLAREAYRREMIPPRVRWWLAAEGMCDWYRVLARDLEPALGEGTRALLSGISVRMFERRWDAMRATHAWLPPFDGDTRALPLLMGALYRVSRRPKARWIFDAMGGAAKNAREELRARVLLARLSAHARWAEMTTHLGELLIVLTEDLPPHLPHARKLLGDLCFRAGARFAERAKKVFGFPEEVPDPPRAAMEILRMSEYVFRVNPEHWSASDGTSGYLEGTACPWFDRPGWNGAHCGIFGQFQSGISSVFGLRYHLSKTIPKHGGSTCRIDVKPIALRRKDEPAPSR